MKPKGKHARPRKKRGNKYTPYIHITAMGCAYAPALTTVRHLCDTGGWLLHANLWELLLAAFATFVIYEVAFAIVFAFATMMWVERHARRNARLLDRL